MSVQTSQARQPAPYPPHTSSAVRPQCRGHAGCSTEPDLPRGGFHGARIRALVELVGGELKTLWHWACRRGRCAEQRRWGVLRGGSSPLPHAPWPTHGARGQCKGVCPRLRCGSALCGRVGVGLSRNWNRRQQRSHSTPPPPDEASACSAYNALRGTQVRFCGTCAVSVLHAGFGAHSHNLASSWPAHVLPLTWGVPAEAHGRQSRARCRPDQAVQGMG